MTTMASVFKRGGKRNRGGYWYISWWEYTSKGRRRRTKCTYTTDKATAQRIAKKHEADAALRRDGVIDPALDAIGKESQRTIESHLADYEGKMRAPNRTEDHVIRTIKIVRTISEWAGFNVAADISADGVNRYAGNLRDKGRSSRTIQAHLTAIKGFTKWLTENHKLPRDPLASVRRPNPKADRRRERRMLLPDEWQWLHAATTGAAEQHGMTGDERIMLYRTAIETGLRSTELRSLSRGRLFLDVDRPYITCKAGSTKNRKDARQYIQRDLAAQLKAHIATKTPKALIFDMPDRTEVAKMLRADLAEARRLWLKAATDPEERMRREQSDFLSAVNHERERLDFHSLRHTCGAWLAMTGEHPKVVQTVMRHCSITLTMDTYGHLFPGQEADAVSRLEGMLANPQTEALQATGTHDSAPQTPEARSAGRSARDAKQCVPGARDCDKETDSEANDPTKEANAKVLRIANLRDDVRDDAKRNESSRSGTRTRTREYPHGILSLAGTLRSATRHDSKPLFFLGSLASRQSVGFAQNRLRVEC